MIDKDKFCIRQFKSATNSNGNVDFDPQVFAEKVNEHFLKEGEKSLKEG